jgi:hypothetical protein
MAKVLKFERPFPPAELLKPGGLFMPAPEVTEWAQTSIISPNGPIHNPEHSHLRFENIGVLWTNVYNEKGMVQIVGTAEMLSFRGSRWQKARQEEPFRRWFGPKFHNLKCLITLYAPVCGVVENFTWCSIVEHELYHFGHAVDEFGEKRWNQDLLPIITMRAHDVEVFIGEVRRYGVGHAAGQTAELVKVAKRRPEVGAAKVRAACGTCLRLVA